MRRKSFFDTQKNQIIAHNLIVIFSLLLADQVAMGSDLSSATFPTTMVMERVNNVVLYEQCHIVRKFEPRGDLTFQMIEAQNLVFVTRRIYSDLCHHPTQQFVTRIFSVTRPQKKPVIIGFMGGNDEASNPSNVYFTSFNIHR